MNEIIIKTEFIKNSIKFCPLESKKVLGDFLLNSITGVKTPCWRKLVGKKYLTLSRPNKICSLKLCFVSLA